MYFIPEKQFCYSFQHMWETDKYGPRNGFKIESVFFENCGLQEVPVTSGEVAETF